MNEEINNSNLPSSYDSSNYVNPQEIDISNMTKADARAFVTAYLETSKTIEKELEELRKEKEKWKFRVKLANDKGEFELAMEADNKLSQVSNKFDNLKAEHNELKIKIDLLKVRLEQREAQIDKSIEPESVLSGIENIVGQNVEEIKVEQDLNKIELEDKLKKLKDKLSNL